MRDISWHVSTELGSAAPLARKVLPQHLTGIDKPKVLWAADPAELPAQEKSIQSGSLELDRICELHDRAKKPHSHTGLAGNASTLRGLHKNTKMQALAERRTC